MHDMTREDAVDATHILNDLIGDFVIAVFTFKSNQARFSGKPENANVLVTSNKMCLSYIVLALNKWLEFYYKYQRLFSGELLSTCKYLTKDLQSRGVNKFRNHCVGHVLNKSTKRPLYPKEVNHALAKITGEDLDSFLNWIHNVNGDKYPSTVVSIIEEARDYLAKDFNIPHSEIMEKQLITKPMS